MKPTDLSHKSKKFFFAMIIGICFLQARPATAQTSPSISSLIPQSRQAGDSAFTLTVVGNGFQNGAEVLWNNSPRVTAFFTSTLLSARIDATDIATDGTAQVSVRNPGGATSNAATFVITPASPVPVITTISPESALAGGTGFVLTVNGRNFTDQSVVDWNGEPRNTIFIDDTILKAEITAADIAVPGTAEVTVKDTAAGGSASNSVPFSIEPYAHLYFPQVAVGGGYTTVFTLVNTGDAAATGDLILTDNDGNPLQVNFSVSTGAGEAYFAASNVFQLDVPAGGVTIVTASAIDAGAAAAVGWARTETSHGELHGIATFRYSPGGVLLSVAGVLPSNPETSFTIPVNNDGTGNRTGIAIANQGLQDVNIRIVTVSSEGQVLDTISPPELNPLGAQEHVAMFLDELIPARANLQGSVILETRGASGNFVVVALVLDQGLLTAIPVEPGKTPNIP